MDTDQVELWLRAARAGDEEAFGRLVAHVRPEIVLHCYRMLGRHDDAEDATQDALLRIWRGLDGFRSQSSARTWIYRIATNVCLDRRERTERRRAILDAGLRHDAVVIPVAATVPWLQAIPDAVLDAVGERSSDHGDALASRETVALAFVAGLQHLGARQRAVLVLRDIVGWSARETAAELGLTLSAANSLLNRARTRMREVLGPDPYAWSADSVDPDEGRLVERYVRAVESGDDRAIAALLAEDVRVSHQPGGGQATNDVSWYAGRELVVAEWAPALHGTPPLHLLLVPARVNRQPALACYARLPGTNHHQPFGLTVLHMRDGLIAEVANLAADQVDTLGIPRSPHPQPDNPTTRQIPPI